MYNSLNIQNAGVFFINFNYSVFCEIQITRRLNFM